MENLEDKKNLKQEILDAVSKQCQKEEDLLKLNEMEEVEGGVCALACLWSKVVGDNAEQLEPQL